MLFHFIETSFTIILQAQINDQCEEGHDVEERGELKLERTAVRIWTWHTISHLPSPPR